VSLLAERLVAVHAALDGAAIPHAFGGAIALAYCTEEPRGTRDLDVNVFVSPEEAQRVFEALPAGVTVSASDVDAAQRDAQVRLWWDDTPIDVFFDVQAFHRHVATRVRTVPFEGTQIPVLDCDALVVFKVLFNRTRDWADIEAMIEAGALEGDDALVWVRELLGVESEPSSRLAALLSERPS
jgi:hypothetical protein